MPRPILLALLALAAPPLAAQTIEIVRPAGGFPSSEPAFEVRLAEGVDPDTASVTLNGTALPATGFETRAEAGATVVGGRMEESLLVPANFNVLAVSARDASGEEVASESHFLWFHVDPDLVPRESDPAPPARTGTGSGILDTLLELLPTIGRPKPELAIERPAMGDFVALEAIFTISGQATDPTGVADLLLALDGGEPVSRLEGLDRETGHFEIDASFDVPGLHRVVVVATNAGGGRSVEKVSVYAGAAPGAVDRRREQVPRHEPRDRPDRQPHRADADPGAPLR